MNPRIGLVWFKGLISLKILVDRIDARQDFGDRKTFDLPECTRDASL